MPALKPATLAPTLTAPALAAAVWLGAPTATTASLFALAVGATLPSLHRAWRLGARPHSGIADHDRAWMRLHVLAHVLPALFVADRLFAGSAVALVAWVTAMALFFYSGRRTWAALRIFRPGKMYFIFKRGNSAMLVMTAALTALSFAIGSASPLLFVERVLALYIGIHAMLVGLAVARIAKDLAP